MTHRSDSQLSVTGYMSFPYLIKQMKALCQEPCSILKAIKKAQELCTINFKLVKLLEALRGPASYHPSTFLWPLRGYYGNCRKAVVVSGDVWGPVIGVVLWIVLSFWATQAFITAETQDSFAGWDERSNSPLPTAHSLPAQVRWNAGWLW